MEERPEETRDAQTTPLTFVTRQDAIQRQLNTAIWLWFHEGDVVSTHTLACSALKIARDVGVKLGKKSAVIDVLNEKDKQLGKLAMIPQDFFKHARKDPDAVLPFNPESTPYHIHDAVSLYQQIYKHISPHMDLFVFRFLLENPTYFPDAPITAPEGFDIDVLKRMNRPEFFKALAPIVAPKS